MGAAVIMPAANTEAMNEHLKEISAQVLPGAHAVLICDGAGWHQRGKKLAVPGNITLIPLPPYSPELNAMENVWPGRRPRPNQVDRNSELGVCWDLVSYQLTLVTFCAKIPSDHSRNDGCLLEPFGCGSGSATGFGQVVAIRACDALDHPDVEQPA